MSLIVSAYGGCWYDNGDIELHRCCCCCFVCDSDVDDEDTLQVDWEWGTVRYKMSNYNPAVRTPSAAVQPPAQSGMVQRTAHHASSARAAAAGSRNEPVNGVSHVSKPNKQISQPVSPSVFAALMCEYKTLQLL